MPSGWQLNGSTSNGIDRIQSTNSVSLTTTASSGNQVKVRAINACASSGLTTGPEATINFERPAPTLQISGDNELCSGFKNFTVTGPVPPGSSICWASSNTNFATVSSQCTNPGSLTYVNPGIVRLSATVNDCAGSFPVSPKEIMVGASVGGYYTITSNYHSSGNQLTLYNNNTTIFLPANQGFGINAYLTSPGRTGNATWTRNVNSYPFFWYQIGASTLTFSGNSAPTAYQQRTGMFNLSIPTACGTFSGQFNWPIVTQGWSFIVEASPNPTANSLKVTIVDGENNTQKLATSNNSNTTLDILRFENAMKVKSWTFKGNTVDFNLDVSDIPNGTYVLRVTIDGISKSTQIIISR